MTTIPDIFTAYAPAYLERFPHLPLAHQKTMTAIRHGHSGHSGHRLSRCHSCGGQPRVQHSCGNRHCPQGPPHTTQRWLLRHLDKQLPGPPFLRTFTVPETLRPFSRSPQRMASHALCKAASTARTRLAQDPRCLGTDLPGCTGILHPWGRQLQSPPHLPSIGPGGGLSRDRTPWRPARDPFLVPVNALSPICRAVCKQEMGQAGLLEGINTKGWHTNWNVHSQANPQGTTSFTYRAPAVFRVAISNRRIVSRTDRPVTVSYRKPGSARPRTTHLDASAFLRRFLPHVLPAGFPKVRHCGCRNPRGATPTDTLRLMILNRRPVACTLPDLAAPAPRLVSCPTGGKPMPLVWRLWTANRRCLDTA